MSYVFSAFKVFLQILYLSLSEGEKAIVFMNFAEADIEFYCFWQNMFLALNKNFMWQLSVL